MCRMVRTPSAVHAAIHARWIASRASYTSRWAGVNTRLTGQVREMSAARRSEGKDEGAREQIGEG